MANERGAGRKASLDQNSIRDIISRHSAGETITALASEYGISRQTIYSSIKRADDALFIIDYEGFSKERFLCRSLSYWEKLNSDIGSANANDVMRIEYMNRDEMCTSMIVNFAHRLISIKNYTPDIIHRAFGIKPRPTWDDFEYFLESRCFPRGRFDLKALLQSLSLDNYDPISILEKTSGRMEEDDQWIRFIYLDL